jgi:hypothetical protein
LFVQDPFRLTCPFEFALPYTSHCCHIYSLNTNFETPMADEHTGTTDDSSNFMVVARLLGKAKAKAKKQTILDVLEALRLNVLSDVNHVHDRSLTNFEYAESNNPQNNLIESAGPSRRDRKTERKTELSNELKTGILDSLNGLYERCFNSFESSIQMIQSFELFEEDVPLSPCISAVSADEDEDEPSRRDVQAMIEDVPLSPCISAVSTDEDEDEPSRRDVQAMIDELRTTCEEWEQIHLDGVAIPGTNVLLHTCGATWHVSCSLLICTTRFIHFSEAVHAVMPKRYTLLTKKGTGICPRLTYNLRKYKHYF